MLGRRLDVEVGLRVLHRIQMGRLPRQVEQKMLLAHEMLDGERIAYITDVDGEPVANIGDVLEIATILRDQAVDQRYVGTKPHQPASKVGADEAKATGYQDTLAQKFGHQYLLAKMS